MVKNFIWFLVMPSTWLWLTMLLAAYGLSKGYIDKVKRLIWVWLVVVLAISIYPVGDIFLKPLEDYYPLKPDVKDPGAIVLLGGGEDTIQTNATGLPHLSLMGTRYITVLALAKQYPQAKVVVSGGVGHLSGLQMTEASVAKAILMSGGIDAHRILLEDASHTTIENAELTKQLIDQYNPNNNKPILLVTTAAHMPRAMGLFCSVGFKNIVPYPTGYMTKSALLRMHIGLPMHLVQLNFGVHEWVGLMINFISGRTSSMFVKKC